MAQGLRLEITGLDKFYRALARYQGDTVKAAAGALFREGERIMTISKTGFVPVDTGALRSSGRTEPPQVTATEITVVLGYGGPAAPYALIVHERLGVYHPNGQSKYLSTPLRAAMPGMDDRLAADIR